MDASASKKTDAEDNLFGLYLKIENPIYSAHVPYNKTVVKYTRLPDFDVNSKPLWSQQYIALEPRLRRIITIEEPREDTHRSLKSNVVLSRGMKTSKICKRKIITIEEDSETSIHPKLLHSSRIGNKKPVNKATETQLNEEKATSQNVSRLAYISKYSKENKGSTKTNMTNNKKETPKLQNRQKYSRGDNSGQIISKNKEINDNESTQSTKSTKAAISSSKFSLSKKLLNSKENENECILKKQKLKENINAKTTPKTVSERTRGSRSPASMNRNKISFFKDIKDKNMPVSVIHVPLDTFPKRDVGTETSDDLVKSVYALNKVNSAVQAAPGVGFKDVDITASLAPEKVNQMTSVDEEIISRSCNDCRNVKETFDSLEIPNVSLINNKTDVSKEEIVNEEIVSDNSKSSVKGEQTMDNVTIQMPNVDVASSNDEAKDRDTVYHKSTSYIIRRATLTYTTKQKINFRLIKENEESHSGIPTCQYPLNVVSVLKKELSNKACQNSEKLGYNSRDGKSSDETEQLNHLASINRPYDLNNDKLVKPSDIISTIKVNNSLLHGDHLCGQFQRELNFIDSFFESLQYLDSCSISERVAEKKVDNFISGVSDVKNFELGSFLSQFENEFNVDNTKTMASESLCLLNLLIQDEQIRAEYLLDVLKMREDALKHFTKSQILWLEDKKKQDNTDISTLKKKQRGALLKLQHECGEMQRMRKALLTLSEQRKLALKKTKKNIELKLKNSSDVGQIILGKKKLRRNVSTERVNTPVKCFELSSSGCDDSTTSRPRSNSVPLNDMKIVTSAEKCVQTGDSLPVTSDQSTNTSDENFVVVDGGYLNILFHNLSLPQIFSAGKQYEVNKEALKNIVHTTNMHNVNVTNDVALEDFMEQIRNHELDSSSPSTARSLVEEFDQIYKGFSDEDVGSYDAGRTILDDIKDVVQVIPEVGKIKSSVKSMGVQSEDSDRSVMSMDECCSCEPLIASVGTQSIKGKEISRANVTGPLPVPVGAAACDDASTEVAAWLTQKSSVKSIGVSNASSLSSQAACPSVSSLASPVLYEAEELRRQQLAIEREIKALEQQQCQLLAIREIPDKPPPPYTPPTDPRPTRPVGKFAADDVSEQKIHRLLYHSDSEPSELDVFDVFVKDFCQESIERQKFDRNENYWCTYDTAPARPKPDKEKLSKKAAADLREVLTGVPPTIVSGVGARRSDQIDDILFAEWRRCEPEWSSLHSDEVIVKNQLFESIFQKILSETVDEYKRTVLSECSDRPVP